MLRRPIASGFAFKLFNVVRVVFVVVHLLNTILYFIGLGYRVPNSSMSMVSYVTEEHRTVLVEQQVVENNESSVVAFESDSAVSNSWTKMIYMELEQLNCELTFMILRGITIVGANLFGLTGVVFPKLKLFYIAFAFSSISLVLSIMNSAMFPSDIAKIDLDLDILCLVVAIVMLRETTAYVKYLKTIESGINELRQSQNQKFNTEVGEGPSKDGTSKGNLESCKFNKSNVSVV